MLGGGWIDRPIGIWNSQNFDMARRRLLRATIESVTPQDLERHPRLKIDALWMLNQLDELEQRRDDITHAPLFRAQNKLLVVIGIYEPVISDTMLNNRRAINLAQRRLKEDFTWCRDTIVLWRDFADAIVQALGADNTPWPDKPVLPTRPRRSLR